MSAIRTSSHQPRLTERDLRVAVAQALLHLWDIPTLADSPLVALPVVQRRAAATTKLFADGIALADYLRETVAGVIERLEGEGKVAILRSLLQGVCAGRSIAQIAREHGKTREHFSRHYWRQATTLVAREIAALNSSAGVRYNAGRVRKPSA